MKKRFRSSFKKKGKILFLEKVDNIDSPSHYKLEGLDIESIEVVKAVLGKEGFKAFCHGNVLKYVIRTNKKNGLEDLKKARKYIDWLIENY